VCLIDRERFDLIRRAHGSYASWAVWAPPTLGAKSNTGDLSILDVESNPAILSVLNGGVIMVGLNISRTFAEPLRNFHDSDPKANDFKLRYAFTGTPYYGAYMTDIIKDFPMVDSGELLRHLRADPSLTQANVAMLRQELRDLGCPRPTILAFGHAAYSLLGDQLSPDEYASLFRLTHYSHRIGKERYRKTVLAQVGAQESRGN